jgi:hypothetical protein
VAVTDTIFCKHILEDAVTGVIEVALVWNGSEFPQTFASRADMVRLAAGGISDPNEMARVLFRWWLARDADASNEVLVLGKTFSVDFSDNNPVKP